MSKYYKHKLGSFYLLGAFEQHNDVKDKILNSINVHKNDSYKNKEGHYVDSISRLDWTSSQSLTREWAKLCYSLLHAEVSKIATQIGYEHCHIEDIWFQQYFKNDTHGWHTHGHNYTLVYYLELDPLSPKTELIDPADQNKKIVPNIKEGDILIFPSYVIHRAPILDNNIRKTIISCNLNFLNANPDILPIINSL